MSDWRSNISLLILILCLIFPASQPIPAFQPNQSEISETEREAKLLTEKWSGEDIRRSIDLYLKAAENWEQRGESGKAADALRETAKSALLISDYKTALASLDKALKLDEKTNDLNGKIISLSLLSRVLRQKGETAKSEKLYRQAIKLSEQTTDNVARANAYYSAGSHSIFYGDIKTTIELLEKALAFARETEDKNLTAQIYRNLGAAYARDGDSDEGFRHAREALKISIAGGDKREQALSYFNIGVQYVWIDKKQLALDNFKLAETDFPNDADLFEKASIANAVAYIYQEYGEIDISEKYRRQAIELFERAENPTGVLAVLPYLAKLKLRKGERDEAAALYDRALKLAIELKDEFFVGIIREHSGDAALEEKRYDAAIENYRATLAVNKKLKIELPRIENSLGKAFELKGDLKLAEEYYQKALARNLEIRDLSPAAENLYNLAHLNIVSGNIEKALEYSDRSLELTETTYADVDNNKLRRTFLSGIYDRYSLNIFLLMKMHERFPADGYALKALQTSERSRARSLLENLRLSEAEFTADADSELAGKEREIRDALSEKAEKLTQALTSGADKDRIEKLDGEINELKNELEKIKGELRAKSLIYSGVKHPTDFDLSEFQENALDDESLFLEFSFGENESYLWLIEKNEFAVVALPKREILENELDEIYDLLASREMLENESAPDYEKRIAENEAKFQKQAQIFSNRLLGKIADKLKNKPLIIAADGKLRYFPVSALPRPNENGNSEINEPLLLTNEIVYEPSAAILNLLARKTDAVKTPEKDLLIFADPVYSRQDERFASISYANAPTDSERASTDELSGQTFSLQRLPATGIEAESIVQSFDDSKTELLAGFSATRRSFFETDLTDYKILHFAAHGLLNENYPEFSGLVFSRFDANGKRDRSIVRLQDIYGLRLNSDLVVLSACDTGIGREIKGEGLISLTDGFLQAGAKTVISSRWKVSDQATLELMKNFYAIIKSENLPPSKALQKAEIKLRENPAFASPYYWAAFTIQGDYRNKPDLTGKFGLSKYLLLVASILALTGFYFLFRKFRR